MTSDEKWLPVVGYEGLYEVSDQGRVRSVDRVVNAGSRGGVRHIRSAARKPVLGTSGYWQVTLQRKTFTIHGLVARAFIGERPDGHEACHNDGNPANNALANLRYDTVSENRLDTVRHGRNRALNKTHCPQGHPYDESNTGSNGGHRRCRTCHRERQNARYHSRKAAP